MIRPGRDRLSGVVEVDKTYCGAEETGLIGRLTENKVIVAIADGIERDPFVPDGVVVEHGKRALQFCL
jgi:hypothetical protein